MHSGPKGQRASTQFRTYDALIGEQTGIADADALLTLNPRHFEPPPAGVTIVEPR